MNGKNTNNSFDKNLQSIEDIDNFDVDEGYSPVNETADRNPLDYGDDFGDQTGEHQSYRSNDEDDYDDITDNCQANTDSSTNYTKPKKSKQDRIPKNNSKKNSLSNNKKIAIVLISAAVLCLTAAIAIACAQCSNSKNNVKATASFPTSAAVTTKAQQTDVFDNGEDDENEFQQTVGQEKHEQNEPPAQPSTQTPTERVTEKLTEPQQPVTEPATEQTATEAPTENETLTINN